MSESAGAEAPSVHFGGPDMAPRLLRDLLRARIEAVPPGGEIFWCTYYFRDRNLAQALAAATDRGVRVVLHVDGKPRRRSVNGEVIAALHAHGLGGGLHVHAPLPGLLSRLHGHLHSKIYYFSDPQPHVLVGSFNPSGDEPEDQKVIEEIGDQDRGHNLLVELTEPQLVAVFRAHVLELSRLFLRFRPEQNRAAKAMQATAWFYPRLCPGVIDRHLEQLGGGSMIRGAISHLKPGLLTDRLIRAAQAGAGVQLIVHDTERRVPERVIGLLSEAGVNIARYVHPGRLPLHAKFLLIDEPGRETAYFGSFNYNSRSRYLNNEVLLASSHGAIYGALAQRFRQILAEMRG